MGLRQVGLVVILTAVPLNDNLLYQSVPAVADSVRKSCVPESLWTGAALAMPTFQLLKEGEVSRVGNWRRLEAGLVRGSNLNYVVLVDTSQVSIFHVDADSLVPLFDYKFRYRRLYEAPQVPPLAVGDFDGDAADEAVLCLGRRVMLIDWNGSGFECTDYEFPYLIYDCVGGDVSNTGQDWIITACLLGPLTPRDNKPAEEPLRLCAFRFQDNEIRRVYDTADDVRMWITDIVPPDRLVCVSDYENVGKKRLVVSNSQSDVSATTYRAYAWDATNGRFELVDSFAIVDCQIHHGVTRQLRGDAYASGPIRPVVVHGITYLLVNYFGNIDQCETLMTGNPAIMKIPTTGNHGRGEACALFRIDERGVCCRRFDNDDLFLSEDAVLVQEPEQRGNGLLVVTVEWFGGQWPAGRASGWFRYFRLSGL